MGKCHEEPLSISHFHFLNSLLCPSIPIISHSVLTLHYPCTSISNSNPTDQAYKKKGYLIVVTQEPTIGSFAAATQEPAVRKKSCCCHTRTSSKKISLVASTQEPTIEDAFQRMEGYKTQWNFHILSWGSHIFATSS